MYYSGRDTHTEQLSGAPKLWGASSGNRQYLGYIQNHEKPGKTRATGDKKAEIDRDWWIEGEKRQAGRKKEVKRFQVVWNGVGGVGTVVRKGEGQ